MTVRPPSSVLGRAVAFCRRGGDLLVLMSTMWKSADRGARHYRQGGDEGDATLAKRCAISDSALAPIPLAQQHAAALCNSAIMRLTAAFV